MDPDRRRHDRTTPEAMTGAVADVGRQAPGNPTTADKRGRAEFRSVCPGLAKPSTTAPIDAVIWLGIMYLVFLLVYRVRKAIRLGPP